MCQTCYFQPPPRLFFRNITLYNDGMKLNYFVTPLLVVVVMLAGSWFTALGVGEWYASLSKPAWQPPPWIFSPVWTSLYAMATVSILLVYNVARRTSTFRHFIDLLLLNAVCNIAWSALFFTAHLIGVAIIVAAVIAFTTLGMIASILSMGRTWPYWTAAALLVPYLVWTSFATYLNYVIWTMN